MDSESRQILENTRKLVEDNNRMLKQINRRQRWASFFQAVYWLIIISLGIGTFYFLQPYVDQVRGFINNSGQAVSSLKNILPR